MAQRTQGPNNVTGGTFGNPHYIFNEPRVGNRMPQQEY